MFISLCMHVCKFVQMLRPRAPLDLPIWINEVSLESYQSSGCYRLYDVIKNKMAATRSQNVCNKNENYTEYHQYGYEVKGLIKTIMKIARKGGLCVH